MAEQRDLEVAQRVAHMLFDRTKTAHDAAELIAAVRSESKAKGFIQGYACAVATLIQLDCCNLAYVKEFVNAGGLTLESLKANEIDEYDMGILAPVIARLQTKEVANG